LSQLTILVLGVGGNVSQGILKALAESDLDCRVLAGCIDPLSLGLYIADRSYVTPLASSGDFLPWVEQVCEKEGVDTILSGVEPVLWALAQAPHLPSLVSPPPVLRVGQDKLFTAEWPARNDLAAPRSADAADSLAVRGLVADCGFPLVAKPRRGKGSERVALLRDDTELDRVIGRPDIVVQEHLSSEDAEYTVGCVCDSDGEPRGVLAMRRTLHAGTTVVAEAGDLPVIREYAEAIARKLGPVGPLNVQLRLVEDAPVAFELNVRFSGTTPLRTRLGFREVEACLRHFILGESLQLPLITAGTVLRYWNELYLPGDAREALEGSGYLEAPGSHSPLVEDWGMRR